MSEPQPIQGRALASALGDTVPDVVMWMPGGVHNINALRGERPINITVEVNASAAAAAQQSLRDYLSNTRQRPCFDFDHDGKEAAGWPTEFFWSDTPEPGVYARVEWSKAGQEAISGKVYRSFSPTFDVDYAKTPPTVIARPMTFMGSLTNDPAFKQIRPLWAKAAGAQSSINENKTIHSMSEQEIAALQAKMKELEQENAALKAKAVTAASEEQIKAKQAEHEQAIAAKQAEIDAVNAKLQAAQEAITAARKKEADEAVQAAVARGALPIKDEAIQAKWRALIEADPSNAVLLAAQPGAQALAGRITRGQAVITREDSRTIMAKFGGLTDPMERGQFYLREIRARLNDPDQAGDVIMAADTYVTTLIVQRTLDLMKWSYPMLSRVVTDFSPERANYGDAITTRTVGAPTVTSYHTTNGYVNANATTTDVAVTMNAHKFVGTIFHANTVASTNRRLFDEQVETSYNGLAKDLSDALLALVLVATFTNTPKTVASVDFDRAAVIDLARLMTEAKIPLDGRTLLLNPEYYAKLAEDTSVVSALINNAAGAAISSGRLPKIHGFEVIEQPNLPSTGNLTGFGYNRSALVIATRTPGDYANALPGLPATALKQIVTNPEDGLSVELTQYVDHKLGMASWRIAIMYGVAAGQVAAGTIVRSAA